MTAGHARGPERSALIAALGEAFRAHGYEGASLARLTAATGLGKGSLYHVFPGGKEEMAAAVLDEVDAWFEREMFQTLRSAADPDRAIADMLDAADAYFRSGRRICLVGALALGDARELFARRLAAYFRAWRDALAEALARSGRPPATAADLAEETVAAIQGALVLARATDDPAVFTRTLDRLRRRLAALGG